MKTGSVAITDAASISVNVGAGAVTNGNALYVSRQRHCVDLRIQFSR